MTLIAVLDTEPELGAQRLCSGCSSWWPLDREFWYFFDRPRAGGRVVSQPSHLCRACWDTRTRQRRGALS